MFFNHFIDSLALLIITYRYIQGDKNLYLKIKQLL